MNTNKSTIFLDFDGLKFDTLPVCIKYVNERYGIQSILTDYIDNNDGIDIIIKKYLPPDQHPLIIWEQVYLDIDKNLNSSIEKHHEVEPMKGMRDILPLLSEKYNVWTVTARQKTNVPVINFLIAKHIPRCIHGIHCVWEYHPGAGFKESSKREFIKNFPGKKIAFIDDSLNEIQKMQDLIPSYHFDHRGHYSASPVAHHRVRSWEEIGHALL